MEEMMMFTSVITGINVVLLSILFVIYLQNYLKMKANFALGLLLFSVIFIIQKLVALYMFLFMMHDYEKTIGTSMFVLEALELIAFTIIVWITVR